MSVDAVELSLFAHRLSAICEEMGAVLRRSAISPNIRDREDFSCALFDAHGELVAQAAHIPVHLGSMAFAMRDVVPQIAWQPGDIVIFNDPALGGTHLPDVTVVAPIYIEGTLTGFAAARAHHADIGGRTPGSMGIEQCLSDEGLILSPQHWYRAGIEEPAIAACFRQQVRAAEERLGDLSAQRAAVLLASERMQSFSAADLSSRYAALIKVSEQYGRTAIAAIPDGVYRFEDALEGDGFSEESLPISVTLSVEGEEAIVDFSGTSKQTRGPMNCPLAVTAASVFYVFRCLMPEHTPQTAAIFHLITIKAEPGTLVYADAGAAVAAGNVETSQRIVDVLLGALAEAIPERIPAASQGTMNNIIFGANSGDEAWLYYETLGGGAGASASAPGISGKQCHMTNTRNSSIEVLEMHYPMRIYRYAIRQNSGGCGRHRGGDGLVRQWQLFEDCHLSLLTERRKCGPYGLGQGDTGAIGRNRLKRDGKWRELPAKGSFALKAGDIIEIETPGGGGFGRKEDQ